MDVNLDFEVHESHLPLWETNARYGFLMGGRGNGRSGTASRYSVSRLFGEEYTRGALVRAVHADIEKSCWAEVYGRFEEQGVLQANGLHVVNGDMVAKYGGNSLQSLGFKSSSGSLTARLKSLAEFNYAWIEEAEEIGEQEFTKLDESLRTTKGRNQIILTLNTPAKSHWIIKRFFDLEPVPEVPGFYRPRLKAEYAHDALYIPGTYRDNMPNIDPATAKLYEKYKETNPAHYWQVIEGLCPETVVGKIYSGWQEIDEVPHQARLIGRGLDFGFDPDPAAVLSAYWYNGGLILDEELYQNGLLNEHLSTSLKAKPNPSAPIVADSAEPKSIAELQGYGHNVIPCEKGPDTATLEPEELELVSEALASFEALKFAKEQALGGNLVAQEDIDAIKGAVRETSMKMRRKGFKEFANLFDNWEGMVDVVTTGEQKNKAANLETLFNVMKTVVSAQQPDGTNVLLQDPVLRRIFNSLVEAAGLSPMMLQGKTAAMPQQPQPTGGAMPEQIVKEPVAV